MCVCVMTCIILMKWWSNITLYTVVVVIVIVVFPFYLSLLSNLSNQASNVFHLITQFICKWLTDWLSEFSHPKANGKRHERDKTYTHTQVHKSTHTNTKVQSILKINNNNKLKIKEENKIVLLYCTSIGNKTLSLDAEKREIYYKFADIRVQGVSIRVHKRTIQHRHTMKVNYFKCICRYGWHVYVYACIV